MNKKIKHLIGAVLILVFALGFSISVSAEEVSVTDTIDTSEKNVFGEIYSEITEYASEILCAMTFVGSLILAFAYRKGLLPIVKGSLISIGNAVSKMKENVSENSEAAKELGKSIESGLEGAKAVLDGLVKRIDTLDTALTDRLAKENDEAKEKEALKLVLLSQIDMLSDIFMSASIPQYQKDAVGERIAKMKGALGKDATAD
jgi:hypothetical protein